jgi:hypothetical protein
MYKNLRERAGAYKSQALRRLPSVPELLKLSMLIEELQDDWMETD